MKAIKTHTLILLLLIIAICAHATSGNESFMTKNIQYKYSDKSEIRLKSKMAYHNQNATIFVKYEFMPDSLDNNYTYTWAFRSKYDSQVDIESGRIDPFLNLYKRTSNALIVKFEVWFPQKNGILFLNVCNKKTGACYEYDLPVNYELTKPKTDLLVFDAEEDLPFFEDFIPRNKKVKIVSLYENKARVFVYQYKHDFKPASPPMSTRQPEGDGKMKIDSVFAVPTNKALKFSGSSLFFVQKDTTSIEGIAFRITSEVYPRFAQVQELINPLVYITTSAEKTKLDEAVNKKKALDEYWLEITQSKDRAIKVISSFYKNIYNANSFFTGYKDGWKTDRGMIYAIFGAPDEVYKTADSEEWYYHNGGSISKLSFTFVKVKNIFSDDHYELIRKSNYERYWYRSVELWRKGRRHT